MACNGDKFFFFKIIFVLYSVANSYGYVCQGGWYGLECKLRCFGHCRNNAFCNHVTGQCDNGCAEGWKGIYSECKDGYYGLDCKFKCSSHCQNNGPCNKKTGHCDEGCEAGYTNLLCNSVCPSGYFGNRCMERCSAYCLNDMVCNHVDGVCADGCDDGYIGDRCDKLCKGGYYGRNCSQKCSPKCIDTCQHTDGSCTCSFGWMGINCNQDSTDSVLPIPLIWFLGLLLSVVLNLCFVLIAGFKHFR
ncbi:multiple epidermal growth factor-like domains protein 11 [Saccostrea echinata]|uniref:multiple epidermal growth factor-like domains protein 11 n=1 Tax=Saccostrea echinata TaxID=191078 RepID=UPI002A809B2D|nr:multiple epidermal growth factor-like domains protein 11 [Saccostrea echinata]